MQGKRWAAGVVVAGLIVGCQDPVGPGNSVAARFIPVGLEVRNGREAAIHYFVVERATAALIDWITCVDDTWGPCPRVEPGATIVIPYGSIPGWGPDAEEALLYWWHVVPAPNGGLAADSIRALVVGK